ncbi:MULTISPECIES: hypothetical protein [unclassified Streptomyces]|uniref:hypothetical protein n=1 Tax=unclassified Streptomyces TaxID=2593676 RepID=UPI00278BED0E|nr:MULTISPECIES: hypothetical protein [unclassified Streptomyces]
MGFPNDEGATEFLRAFRASVYPQRWREMRAASPPLPMVVLGTGGDAAQARQRRRRVLDALERALASNDGRLVCYARPQHTPADRPGEELLALRAGRELCLQPPRHTGRLRLRDFHFVARMVQHALRLARDTGPDALTAAQLSDRLQAIELRNDLYEQRAAEPDGLPHHLAKLVPAPDGGNVLLAYVSRLLSQPLFHSLPRKLWDRRWGRRLLRSRRYGWYRSWMRLAHPASSVFDQVSDMIVAQSLALRGSDHERENALLELEKLLVRALLSDLDRAHPARFGPWKRRRRTRRVVLLDMPPHAEPEGRDAARFLQAYREAYRARGSASLFVVGVGDPQEYPEVPGQEWRWELADSLPVISQQLTDPPPEHTAVEAVPWVLDRRFDDAAFQGEGLPVSRLQAPKHRVGPRTEATALVVAAIVAAITSLLIIRPGGPGSGVTAHCLDGARVAHSTGASQPLTGVAAARDVLSDDDPAAAYRKVVEQIRANNELAEKDERDTRKKRRPEDRYVVREVVYIGPSPAEGSYKALAELRGVWLAQARLNSEAHRDDSRSRVQLRVDIKDAGKHFERAERIADDVVDRVEKTRDYQDHRTVVGVIGFAESRRETKAAARILSDHQVPTISTTASADAMQTAGPYYRPMAPSDNRESELAVQLAHKGAVIAEGDTEQDLTGSCETAARAVVVSTPDDLYSNEIGREFATKFNKEEPGGAKRLLYSGESGELLEIGRQICAYREENRRTVVYWSSRVNSFRSFLDSYANTKCAGRTLTVIAGNDITNAELNGDFKYNVPWLRLYHTAHVLPVGHELASSEARRYAANYAYYAGAKDKWRNDGHGPMAFDAFRVLSLAADDANGSNREDVTPSAVKSKLDSPIALEGASGAIRYPQSNPGSRPPREKAIVIERATAGDPSLVLYCGAFGLNEKTVTTWNPGQEPCPADAS